MAVDPNLVKWDELALDKVTEMVSRRVVVDAEAGRVLVQSHLRKGALVPLHTHAGEQSIRVFHGSLAVTVAGVRTTLNAGGVLVVPAGAPHEAEALDDTVVVDMRYGDVEFGS